ncbi:MAG: ribosome assembly factor SBDS [Candidatus Helarchaeota archaeon]
MVSIRGQKRVDLSKAAIVKYDISGHHFEILVDPKLAWKYKEKQEETDIRDILLGYYIFTDAFRGEKITDSEVLKEIFNTDDIFQVSEIILKNGELHITAEMRKQFTEQIRKKIIYFINRNCINPKTKLPHPPARIERAMEEANIRIDANEEIVTQAKKIVKKLAEIIPIKMERITVAVKIPSQFTGKAYGIVSKYGTISQDEWQSDGSWIALIDLPAGLQAELNEQLRQLTKGKHDIKNIKETLF